MKYIWLFITVAIAAVFCIAAETAQSQSPFGTFPCIVQGNATYCPVSLLTPNSSLESNTAPYAIGAIVLVSGYHSPGDGGAGEYVMLGSPGGSPSVCNGYNSGLTNVKGNADSSSLSITGTPYPAGLTVGELVTQGGASTLQVQPGSEVASITTSGGNIVAISLTLPLTGSGMGASVPITITGNNAGTLFLDSYGGAGASSNQCWQKTNYRGDPHEFGAYGDANKDGTTATGHDDTTAIQNWLGAYGNVSSRKDRGQSCN
jgi:hypothetical protein